MYGNTKEDHSLELIFCTQYLILVSRSGHELIVVDIQGVGDLYTDPQIHTSHGQYSRHSLVGLEAGKIKMYENVVECC